MALHCLRCFTSGAIHREEQRRVAHVAGSPRHGKQESVGEGHFPGNGISERRKAHLRQRRKQVPYAARPAHGKTHEHGERRWCNLYA